jgi:spore maturation protein SpmB
MGRPLKIAKAQAVLTITDTTAATGAVTVTESLTTTGVIAGMPFVVATTVGGLTANTTYWVLTVIDANNFTASATDLSANTTRTAVTLSDTTGGSVSMSVGVVDAYFNNPLGGAGFPATNANTYGVVGGNTAIIGSQVLPRVAIGISGTGNIYSSDASALVYGAGTDFANTVSTGSAIQAVAADGTTTNLGFATSTFGYVSVAVANTVVSGNVIGTTGNALTLAVNQPVSFSANLGTLVTGTTYFVNSTPNAAAFTVSASLGGAPKVMTAATGTPDALQDSITLAANASATITGLGQNYVYANDEAGFILRQKGKTKYLVQGGTTGLVAQCYTANVANTALTPNTMNILSTDAASATAYVSSVNDYNSEVFPTQVDAGSLSAGTLYTIYSTGTTDWSDVGAASNMTGVTFLATGAGSGTGTAVVYSVNPDVIATFNTAYAANTYDGQPNPIVTIANA